MDVIDFIEEMVKNGGKCFYLEGVRCDYYGGGFERICSTVNCPILRNLKNNKEAQ